MTNDEFEDNVKKILCCASLIKDLTTAKALVNREKLEKIMQGKESKGFIASADAFSVILK